MRSSSPLLHDYKPTATQPPKKSKALQWFVVGLGAPFLGLALISTLDLSQGASPLASQTPIDMATSMSHQKDLVDSGYWPLYRFDPAKDGDDAFRLDSREPSKPFREVAASEARYAMLARANPEGAEELMDLAQQDIDDRWELYRQFTNVVWAQPEDDAE